LLCRSGLFPVATITYASFPYPHETSVKIGVMKEEEILSGSWLPQDINTIKESLKGTNFELLEAQTMQQEIRFNNYDELYEFGMRGGWLTQFFSALNIVQIGIIKALGKNYYPFSDRFEGLIFLLQKKD